MGKISSRAMITISIFGIIEVALIVLMLMALFTGRVGSSNDTQNKTTTLQAIADQLKTSAIITQYTQTGYTIAVTASANRLTFTINNSTTGIQNKVVDMTLNGNTLIGSAPSDDTLAPILFMAVVDSTQQLLGKIEGESIPTLNSTEIQTYTLSTNHIEVSNVDNTYTLKFNINTPITLIDNSITNNALTAASFTGNESIMKGDGDLTVDSKDGTIKLMKSGTGNAATILIFEKNSLTDNAYKSFVACLTTMYSDTVATSFSTDYTSFSDGDKIIEAYHIDIDPTLNATDQATATAGNYKVVKITIDKTKITA